MSFRHHIRVRYDEVDMQRVVFNAHYLTYCDDAVSAWFASLDVDHDELDWDCMVRRAEVEWEGSATYGDTLEIDLGVGRWGTSSYDVDFRGVVGPRPVFRATITYVSIRPGVVAAVPTPERVRRLLS